MAITYFLYEPITGEFLESLGFEKDDSDLARWWAWLDLPESDFEGQSVSFINIQDDRWTCEIFPGNQFDFERASGFGDYKTATEILALLALMGYGRNG